MGDIKNKRLMIIQPILADYRIYFFNKLASVFDVSLYCDIAPNSSGHSITSEVKFNVTRTPITSFIKNKIYYQKGLLKGILKFKPDSIFITAHPKNISFWLVLLLSKILSIKTYIHGQGFYNKPNSSFVLHLTYKCMFFLCHKYVCYTPSTQKSFENRLPQWCLDKCFIADNTIYNEYSLPHSKKNFNQKGIFYVGRIREGSNVDLLAEATISLNSKGVDVILHIIGAGDDEAFLKKKYEKQICIKFYGRLFDQQKITDISKECFIGCYPGQAGLSIVHHMSLSLPSLVHSDLTTHMGPEPSYITHNINGFLFNDYSSNSIVMAIEDAYERRNTKEYSEIGFKSYQTYSDLINPDFADKIITAIKGIE